LDFRDDGGTPDWRYRRTINHARQPRLGFGQICMLVVFVGAVLPFVILFGGIFCLAVWDSLVRYL